MTALIVPPSRARSALGEHVAKASEIVISAAMVGDADDFLVWARRCKDWNARLARSLAELFGDDASDTFQRATRPSPSGEGWQESLAEELDRVQGVLEMLGSLSRGLPDGSPEDLRERGEAAYGRLSV